MPNESGPNGSWKTIAESVTSTNTTSNANDTFTVEKLTALMKSFAAEFPNVVTTTQLPPLHRHRPMAIWDDPPYSSKHLMIDYLSLLRPTGSPGIYHQMKGRATRPPAQPPKLNAMQLRDAELRHVPGLVLRVDEKGCISTGEHVDEVTEWVKECCEALVHRSFTAQHGVIETYRYTFNSEVDKVMFKLRWPCD